MAIQNFIDGALYGKIGGFVGANWRGVDYMRAYAKPKQPDSPAQVLHKQNFRRLIVIANNLHKVWFPYVFDDKPNKTLSNQFMTLNKGIYKTNGLTYTVQLPYNATGAQYDELFFNRFENYATAVIALSPNTFEGTPIGFLWMFLNVEKYQVAFYIGRSETFRATVRFPESWKGDIVYHFSQLVTDKYIYKYSTSTPAPYLGNG